MSIKTKVALGVVFLFSMILIVGGVGLYYLNDLSGDSQNILKDNYETLEYTKRIIENCDDIGADSAQALKNIEDNLVRQEANVTESGERELTYQLRLAFEGAKTAGMDGVHIIELRRLCLAIQELNMQAIVRKNGTTLDTSKEASTYLVIVCTFCFLGAFTFLLNFPGYVANPIAQLTDGIKAIANKNYEERIQFDRSDEFEELAEAFNMMAEKLDEYEHSSLAKIIFEKKRIETIINRMNDPLIGLDEKDVVVFVNDPALNLLNLTLEEVIDRYAPDVALYNDLFRNLVRVDKDTSDKNLIKAVLAGKENYFSKESIFINYTPTGEKDAVNIGQVIILRNITSYKELDIAKTNFIATISHELKTPIASLQMGVRLLQDNRVGVLNDEQANIANTLRDEVARISKITNELLDLSQVESGNIKLNIKKTDPKDVVRLALEAVKFQAERKHVRIDVQIDKVIPGIQADIDKTTWVLVNFLTNAIRYSPENERIELKCIAANGHVGFHVTDKGPGIEAKYIGRIFEKFFQIPGTPTGTGLGLAISKEFIEAQHGTIHIESTFGNGSTFSFQLLKA